MALAFFSTAPGTSADYRKYLYDAPGKTDRDADSILLDFTLAATDASFVKLNRGNYVKFTTTTYPIWYTGYIMNEPEYSYLGEKAGVPHWGYKYEASSDEVLLSQNTLGIIPPFLNTTQGRVLKTLAALIAPGVFDVTNVQDGLTLARYIVDPTKKFVDVVKEFADGASYRFYGQDHKLFYLPKSSITTGLTVDGSSLRFSPASLSIKASTSIPIINDAVVIGDIEPQNYVADYFVGSGFDGEFPLSASVFGVSSAVLQDEDFSGSGLDSSKWVETDQPTNFIQISGGFLNILGGSANSSYDVHLDSANLLPLSGAVRFTHGDFDFVPQASNNLVCGIIAGSWTQAPNVSNASFACTAVSMSGTTATITGTFTGADATWIGKSIRFTGFADAGNNGSFTIVTANATTVTLVNAAGVTHAVQTATGVIDTYVGCVYGLRVNKNGGAVSLSPIINGVVDGTQIVTVSTLPNGGVTPGAWSSLTTYTIGQFVTFSGNTYEALATTLNNQPDTSPTDWALATSPRYVLRTLFTAQRIFRVGNSYTYLKADGTIGTFGGATYADTVVATTYVTELDPNIGLVTAGWPKVMTNSFSLAPGTTWATYIPAASNDLHITLTNITISTPMQASLAVEANGTSAFAAKIIGPNEVDSVDGLSPFATIVETGGTSLKQNLLGSPLYHAGDPKLEFFKNSAALTTTVPQKGDIVRLRYRAAGAAIGRARDTSSISGEAVNWGDSGVRNVVHNGDLNPLPITSEDCEAAAASIIGANSFTHYEGTYEVPSQNVTSEPLAGAILPFINLPAGAFVATNFKEPIYQVATTFLASRGTEKFTHVISFGLKGDSQDLRSLLSQFTKPAGVFAPQDTVEMPAYVPVSSVGLAHAPDVTNLELDFSGGHLLGVDPTGIYLKTNQAPPLSPNLYIATEDFTNAAWQTFANGTATVPVVTANATTDPLGGSTADQIAFPITNSTSTSRIFQMATLPSVPVTGSNYVASLWLKAAAPCSIVLLLKKNGQGVGFGINQVLSVTTAWQRFTISGDASTDSTTLAGVTLEQPQSAAAVTLFAWGAQFEPGTSPTTYISASAVQTVLGGFEARYNDGAWGVDDAKNLALRTTLQTFSIPRNNRGGDIFVKAFDARNRILWSEDLTQSIWVKVAAATAALVAGTDPDGNAALVNSITLPTTANIQQVITGVPASGSTAAFTMSFKGTAGQQVQIDLQTDTVFGVFTRTVTFTGSWQRETIGGVFGTQTGRMRVQFNSVSGVSTTFQCTRASLELNTTIETTYCKTKSTPYGASSRYAASVHTGYPAIPAAPTALADTTNVTAPVVTVGLPVLLTDVWGIELRASDNSTVLYHSDLTDTAYNPKVTITGNATRSLSYFAYTYNILGEYSPALNLVVTIPTPAVKQNWLIRSEEFDNAAWNKGNLTITANATTDPLGGSTADKLQVTATATAINNQAVIGAGRSLGNTYSIYVKQGSSATVGNIFNLRNDTTSTNLIQASVNLTTGVVTNVIGAGCTVINVGSGWWRVVLTATTGISDGDTIRCYAGWIGNSATAGDFVFLWGAQLEQTPVVGTYVSTSATPVIVSVSDASKSLVWLFGASTSTVKIEVDDTSSAFGHIILTDASNSGTAELLSDQDYFRQRWFRITPFDVLGSGTPVLVSHIYTPTGVVQFNSNEVASIPAPGTPTTDPSVPAPLADNPNLVLDRSWANRRTNMGRY